MNIRCALMTALPQETFQTGLPLGMTSATVQKLQDTATCNKMMSQRLHADKFLSLCKTHTSNWSLHAFRRSACSCISVIKPESALPAKHWTAAQSSCLLTCSRPPARHCGRPQPAPCAHVHKLSLAWATAAALHSSCAQEPLMHGPGAAPIAWRMQNLLPLYCSFNPPPRARSRTCALAAKPPFSTPPPPWRASALWILEAASWDMGADLPPAPPPEPLAAPPPGPPPPPPAVHRVQAGELVELEAVLGAQQWPKGPYTGHLGSELLGLNQPQALAQLPARSRKQA